MARIRSNSSKEPMVKIKFGPKKWQSPWREKATGLWREKATGLWREKATGQFRKMTKSIKISKFEIAQA